VFDYVTIVMEKGAIITFMHCFACGRPRTFVSQLLLGLACFILPSVAPAGSAPDLVYTISTDWDTENRQLIVSLEFIGEDDGTTSIRIPHAWAWQDSYERGIKNFRALSDWTSVTEKRGEHEYVVHHPPAAEVAIQYVVVQYWDEPITRDVYYRPILGSDFFHFIGHGLFVYPDWDLEKTREIRVTWNNLPATWNLANSFGVGDTDQTVQCSLDELCHAVYMGGNIRVHQIDVMGRPVFTSIIGDWQFQVDDFDTLVGKTVRAVREYWNDFEFPFFLVTMIPTDQPCCSKGGTGLSDSYGLFVSAETEDLDDLKFLLAHELFHTWNGRKIQRQHPEELVYWFAEGFTDYFTLLILLRSGLITLQEYIEDVNRTLVNLHESPARNITNQEILERTHKDQIVERIPYLRGDLVALRWDAAIKRVTGGTFSLDNLMKDLLNAAINSGTLVSSQSIDSLIRPYLRDGVVDDIQSFIDSGKTVVLSDSDLGPCVSLDTVEISPFDLGFCYSKPKEGDPWMISGVDPEGPAFAAGLRDGQTLEGRSIHWNQTEKPVVLQVRNKNGELKEIKYYPKGKPFPVPQFRLDLNEYKTDSSACLKWFGL